MSKIKLYNVDNELIAIEVIRYFKNNDIKYIIYTLIDNSDDTTGYSKLYVAKNIDNYLTTITEDTEWTLIKDVIKNVIKSNRDGIEINVFDQNEGQLENLVLKDSRVFKLQGNLVNLLQENKKIEVEIEEQPIDKIEYEEESEEDYTEEVDYKILYEEEKEKNKKLTEIVEKLQINLKDINNILEEL